MTTDMFTLQQETAGWRVFSAGVSALTYTSKFEIMLRDGTVLAYLYSMNDVSRLKDTSDNIIGIRIFEPSLPNTAVVPLDDLKKMNAMLKLAFGDGVTTNKLDAIIRNTEV